MPAAASLSTEQKLRQLPPWQLAHSKFSAYIGMQLPKYEWSLHNLAIASVLERVESGDINRLIVNMPPRHGKTLQISELFPAWYLGRNPEREVLFATYSFDRSGDCGRKVRNQMIDPYHKKIFPGCSVSKDAAGANRMMTDQGGAYVATGVGGGIIGRGAHLFIIDDPISSRKDADSDTMRKQLLDWYRGVAYTRLMTPNVVILVMCLAGDTPVLMADGSWKKLQDICTNDQVMTHENGRHVPAKVLNVADQGEDLIYEVFTDNHRVRGNARHPFLVKKKNGFHEWVRLIDLKKDDEIVVSRRIDFSEKQRLSLNEAWLLGFMFGDGWITINRKKNHNKKLDRYYSTQSFVTCVAKGDNLPVQKKIFRLFKELFNVVPKDTGYGYYRTEVARVGHWFIDVGLIGKARTKRVPKFIFSQPVEVRNFFLDGFRCADGHRGTWNEIGQERFYFCNANEDLIEDIRTLARSCGHAPSIKNIYHYEKKAPNSPRKIKTLNARISMLAKKTNEEFVTAKVRKIQPIGMETVYDIQVEGTENFIADGMVVHNTRWHFDDLAGFLVEEMKHEGWAVLTMPAIADNENDPIGRGMGEALWPERYNLERLTQIKTTIGTREWNAQYQQVPMPDEGGMVNVSWFKRYNWKEWLPWHVAIQMGAKPPKETPLGIRTIVMSWDTAYKEAQLNDPSACTIWGLDKEFNCYLLGIVNERMNYPKLKKKIVTLWKAYSECTLKGPIPLIIEDRASGQSLINDIKRFTAIPVIAINPEANKQTRMAAVSPVVESGKVFLPDQPLEWVIDYETQIGRFPLWRFDDLVDSTSQFLQWIYKPRLKRNNKLRFWK